MLELPDLTCYDQKRKTERLLFPMTGQELQNRKGVPFYADPETTFEEFIMGRTEAMIQYENTVPALFLRRINRFIAEVLIGEKKELVHVKNTGRLQELLVPEAKVTLQKASAPERKTAYDLISVYKPGLRWVNIDSLAPNALMKRLLMSLDYDVVKPEYTYGDSRFDFFMMKRARTAPAGSPRTAHEMEHARTASASSSRTAHEMERAGEKYLTEIKGCTLAADLKKGIGRFPDAPTERGVKHLEELAAAAEAGYHCEIAFVIQMNGIRMVFPNDETQPEFGQALVRAAKAGVQVVYYPCQVEADRIRITGAVNDTDRYRKLPTDTRALLI